MIVRQHLVQFWILMRYLYQSNLAFWRGNLVCLNYYLISWLKLGSWEKHREEKWCYLTEAFDSVPQERLLIEIHAYGIRGPLPSWLRSFLTNRCQRVVLRGTPLILDFRFVWRTPMQGTVLGPILFVMYIKDISRNITSHTKLFADDMKVHKAMKDKTWCWRTTERFYPIGILE